MSLRPFAILGGLLAAGTAHAVPVEITYTNLQSAGGVSLTPALTVLHDGSYDAFDAGSAASSSVEQIAEEGSTAAAEADLGAAGIGTFAVAVAPAGGAPVLEPGESTTVVIDVDPMAQRFLSFLAMVIPSNDLFVGNDDAMAYEIFDAAGDFSFSGTVIEIAGADVWDAGTEANDGQGAAFSTDGGTATDTAGVVTSATMGDLAGLVGINTPLGQITSAPGLGTSFASITVSLVQPSAVPLPAGLPLALLGLGALGLASRRRSA